MHRLRPAPSLLQLREGCRRQYLVSNACDDGAVTLAVVTGLMPVRVVLERRPLRLTIRKRFPGEYVRQLVARFPDNRRPETDGANAVFFPDRNSLISKPSQKLGHLARNRLIYAELVKSWPISPPDKCKFPAVSDARSHPRAPRLK